MENYSAAKLATVSANIVSVYQAGSFFGAFAGYPIGYYLGRKWGLILAGLVFCVGAVMQCVASHKTGLGIMYAGRVIVGFCIGITSNLAVSIQDFIIMKNASPSGTNDRNYYTAYLY
jgi:MFS family permease